MGKFPLLAVVTIEGGGAFGFSLLGQLQAVLDSGILPIAFAGTSAGAIIATLHWAGYKPSQIRDKLCELADNKQITGLMGPFKSEKDGEAFDFEDFLTLKKKFETLLKEAETAITARRRWFQILPLFRKVQEAGAILRPHLRNRGLFPGDALTDTLDRWLREAPNLDEKARDTLDKIRPRGEKVTFGDFAAATGSRPLPPLFLPITNVTKRRLELVCSIDQLYAAWPIARAVRASAGFPGFFRPVSFGHPDEESYCVDGGVIANYPAWVFGHQFRQRLYQINAGREFAIRPWLHVGLCFGPPSQAPGDPDRGRTPSSFMKGFASLLRGGARQELERQIVNLIVRLIEIRQPEDETGAPESLLDFAGCDRMRIQDMFKKGRAAARKRLESYEFDYPQPGEIEPALEELVRKALLCFGQIGTDGTPDNSKLQLRANVFLPMADQSEDWRVTYSVNMTGDSDEDLALPKFAGLAGMCVGLRRPLICNLEEFKNAGRSGKLDKEKLLGMPEELLNKVRPDRTWLASVPIFDQYASYPTRIGEDIRRYSGRYHELAFGGDGAVIGVLNLDAALPYQELNLPTSREEHSTSTTIQTIIDVMRSVASELGRIFSMAFGSEKESVHADD